MIGSPHFQFNLKFFTEIKISYPKHVSWRGLRKEDYWVVFISTHKWEGKALAF